MNLVWLISGIKLTELAGSELCLFTSTFIPLYCYNIQKSTNLLHFIKFVWFLLLTSNYSSHSIIIQLAAILPLIQTFSLFAYLFLLVGLHLLIPFKSILKSTSFHNSSYLANSPLVYFGLQSIHQFGLWN